MKATEQRAVRNLNVELPADTIRAAKAAAAARGLTLKQYVELALGAPASNKKRSEVKAK